VAVGLRGHILLSDDDGKSWTQAKVPVQVDLVAVSFSSPTQGWAVGHRGVVLETVDGGSTWQKRFAGQQLNELIVRHYEAQSPSPESPAARALNTASRAIKEGSAPALLDVWFDTPTTGTIVGTFNTILRTEDGGKTWVPWMDRIDNPEELHFYAVRGEAGSLYLAGEKGSVWRFEKSQRRWIAAATGYAGTLFGVIVNGPSVLAFGMRGSAFASDDAGKTWRQVAIPSKAGLVAGVRLRSGDIVLADQTGELLRSRDAGRSFEVLGNRSRIPSFGLAEGHDGQLISAGMRGVAFIPIASRNGDRGAQAQHTTQPGAVPHAG